MMKEVLYGVAITLGVMLALMGVNPAQGGMMSQGQMPPSGEAREPSPGGRMGQEGMGGMGMMGPQMMRQMMRGMMGGGMAGMPERMRGLHPGRLVRLLRAELGLSDDQAKQLREIFSQAAKNGIKQRADLRIAELELRELLEADTVDMAQVEAKLKAIESVRTGLRLSLIRAHEQAKAVLTPEQRQKLLQMHDRLRGMLGLMEMMGEAGQGGMGTMESEMMAPEGMGGMLGGQPQQPRPTAATPNLTQRDAQGAVTVEATLLTPDKPRADGKLAVRVKLDTHAVDLDQYPLEKLAMLRDGLGREMPAMGLESASGSGHHREGVLTFPATDASGKPVLSPEAKTLTLILRDIGGVPERAFHWRLPLS
jgi:Spy/CpxP family protein refolding chaperone